jgi:hypothetical protein
VRQFYAAVGGFVTGSIVAVQGLGSGVSPGIGLGIGFGLLALAFLRE